jgi:cytochrome c5
MRKFMSITVVAMSVLFVSLLIMNQLNAQNTKKVDAAGKPIPANVQKLFERSCYACHSEPGSMMAKSHLDFTNWDKYSAEKQADKAKAICTMVTKDKMPPKPFVSKHPGTAIMAEELTNICNWAQSLQVDKK